MKIDWLSKINIYLDDFIKQSNFEELVIWRFEDEYNQSFHFDLCWRSEDEDVETESKYWNEQVKLK